MGKHGQRFHRGRAGQMLAPGKTGFLFSTVTGPVDRSKREIETLLSKYTDLSGCEFESMFGHKEEEREVVDGVEGSPLGGEEMSVAAMLAKELAESAAANKKGGGKKVKAVHPYKLLECNCKGYLFYSLDRPPAGDEDKDAHEAVDEDGSEPGVKRGRHDESEDSTVPVATRIAETAEAAVSDEEKQRRFQQSMRRFSPNPNVSDVADTVFNDLLRHPKVVARFTYKMIPIVASCNPSADFIVPLVKQLTSTLKVPEGRSAIKISVIFMVRNNTTVEKTKSSLKHQVEAALPMNKFVTVNPVIADVVLHIAVMHSTACIGLSTDYITRKEYNLHKISEAALQLDTMATSTRQVDDEAEEVVEEE